MFNGGTGLLAKNRISKNTLNAGWIVSTLLALLVPAAMVFLFHYHWLLFGSLGLALFLGVEYSFPPLRLSRIGLGEAAAFIAYGVPFLTVGFVLQNAAGAVICHVVRDYKFYLLALPVSSSVAVTLCLTQIPDTDADRRNGKKMINIMGLSFTSAVFSALVPTIYFLADMGKQALFR